MKKVELTGSATIGSPGAGCCASGVDIEGIVGLSFCSTVTSAFAGSRTINDLVSFVNLLTSTGLTTVSLVVLKVLGGANLEVRYSTPGNADQVVRASGFHLIANPTLGSEITALAVRGNGQIEYIVAGS